MDENVTYMTREEIEVGLRSEDLETKKKFSDGVLAKSIRVKTPEMEEQQNTTPENQYTEPVVTAEQSAGIVESSSTIPEEHVESEAEQRLREEIERERRLAETRLQQAQEEWERKLKEAEAEKNAQIEQERKEREQLQKRLIEESVKQQERIDSQNPNPVEEEDDYASDYSKTTRKMVDELKNNFRPELLAEIQNRLKQTEDYLHQRRAEDEQEKEARKRQEEQRKQREAQDKLFNSVESFQKAHPELMTEKSVRQLNEDFIQFYKDIAYLVKSNDQAVVNRSIYKFFDPVSGKDLRDKADRAGIRPPAEIEKFQQLSKLVDMANGIEVDPVTGEVRQLTNDFGKPVAYPNLEAAYIALNPTDYKNRVRRDAYKEVGNKLEERREGAVTLSNHQVANPEVKMSKEEALQYLKSDSPQFRQGAGNMEKLKLAYSIANYPMPSLRGR